MSKPIKQRMHEYVMYRAKRYTTKNLAVLVYLPFTLLGFLWGLAFFGLRATTTNKFVLGTAQHLGVTSSGVHSFLSFLPWLSLLVPLFISFFYIGLFCRAAQVLLPDEFDDITYDK